MISIPIVVQSGKSVASPNVDRTPVNARKLRIVLIYPPPWRIPSPGEPAEGMPYGPPKDKHEHPLEGDFTQIPYGLMTIAAQVKRAGHEVNIYNLAITPWKKVVALIEGTDADIYGISVFTANRRGAGALAELIRRHRPQAHITVGGPFISALPASMLKHYRNIDTAVVGEGEETFLEIVNRVSTGLPTTDIPGAAWRNGDEVTFGETRDRIMNLDELASPFDYFTNQFVMTSRGCPSKCTFCGSFTTWGRKVRFLSVDGTIDTFRKVLARLEVPFLVVMDDTFTAQRKRAIAICDAIIESGMNFMWSCNTRIDSLDDELLRKMRLAGCQRISLGVESGSPLILESIHKKTTPEQALEITKSARDYGIHVRYFMIVGNRGETPETMRQSIDLIKQGRPSFFSFCTLGFLPGTEEWEILRETQGYTPDVFFTGDFRELSVATNRYDEWDEVLRQMKCEMGSFDGYDFTVEEREAIAQRLPGLHSVHLELGNAYMRAGRLDEASKAFDRAEDLGFPIKGLLANQRACLALARNDIEGTLALLEQSLSRYPHHLVKRNIRNLRLWLNSPLSSRGKPPLLNDSTQASDFQQILNNSMVVPEEV